MQTLDQCLADLVTKGVVSKEEARYKAARTRTACRQATTMDREQGIKLMQDLLRRVTEKKASDLFITAGFPPAIKIDGEVRPQCERALTAEQSAVLVRAIMNDRQTKEFDATKECNFAIAPPGIGRFRVNAFVQQGNYRLRHPPDQLQDSHARRAGTAARAQGSGAVQARPRDHGRRHGLG